MAKEIVGIHRIGKRVVEVTPGTLVTERILTPVVEQMFIGMAITKIVSRLGRPNLAAAGANDAHGWLANREYAVDPTVEDRDVLLYHAINSLHTGASGEPDFVAPMLMDFNFDPPLIYGYPELWVGIITVSSVAGGTYSVQIYYYPIKLSQSQWLQAVTPATAY